MSSTKAVGVRIDIDVFNKIKQLDPCFVLSDFVRCALQEHSNELSKNQVREFNRFYIKQQLQLDKQSTPGKNGVFNKESE